MRLLLALALALGGAECADPGPTPTSDAGAVVCPAPEPDAGPSEADAGDPGFGPGFVSPAHACRILKISTPPGCVHRCPWKVDLTEQCDPVLVEACHTDVSWREDCADRSAALARCAVDACR